MKSLWKRITAMLCAAVMSVGMFSISASAATVYARSGKNAMKANLTTAAKWSGPTNTFPCKADTDYVLSAWIKGTGKVSITVKTKDWKQIASVNSTGGNDWIMVTLPFNSGENTSIMVQLIDSNVEGTMYIDDITVIEKGDSTNTSIISNGGFEGNESFWKLYGPFEIAKGDEAPPPKVTAGQPAPVVQSDVLIDEFGQFIRAKYDEKITSIEELRASIEEEKKYLASLTPANDRDEYGGLANSKDKYGLKATGFFHVERVPSLDNRWVMVDPIGNLFFNLAVCGVAYEGDTYTKVGGREAIYEWLPTPDDPEYKTTWREGSKTDFSFYISNWIKKYDKPIFVKGKLGLWNYDVES